MMCRNMVLQGIQLGPSAALRDRRRTMDASKSVCKHISCRKQILFSPRFLVLGQ